jgi:hypothetical protein
LPELSIVAVWEARVVQSFALGVHLPVDGLYNSQLTKKSVSPTPPMTSAVPELSRTEVIKDVVVSVIFNISKNSIKESFLNYWFFNVIISIFITKDDNIINFSIKWWNSFRKWVSKVLVKLLSRSRDALDLISSEV